MHSPNFHFHWSAHQWNVLSPVYSPTGVLTNLSHQRCKCSNDGLTLIVSLDSRTPTVKKKISSLLTLCTFTCVLTSLLFSLVYSSVENLMYFYWCTHQTFPTTMYFHSCTHQPFLHIPNVLSALCSSTFESSRAHLHVVGKLRFVSDINQPSLPTPFNSVLVSISDIWPFQLYFIP